VALVGQILAVIYTLPWDGIKKNYHLNSSWYSNGGLVCGAMSLTTAGNGLQNTTPAERIEAVLSPNKIKIK
jgi:uncharacterized membrane protein YdcZ (DUF606 family)